MPPIRNPGGGSGGGGSGTVTGVLATSPVLSDGNPTTPTISLASGIITTQAIAAPYILQKSGAPVSGTNTTGEEVLRTIAVPAAAMGANGVLTLEFSAIWTTSANNKVWRIRVGAAGSQLTGTQIWTNTVTNAGVAGFTAKTTIQNTNSTSAQVAWIVTFTANASLQTNNATASVATASAWEVCITCAKALGTETDTVLAYNSVLLSDGL